MVKLKKLFNSIFNIQGKTKFTRDFTSPSKFGGLGNLVSNPCPEISVKIKRDEEYIKILNKVSSQALKQQVCAGNIIFDGGLY